MAPPALDHVVRRCLAKDPEERWQNAQDVAHQLKWIGEAASQAGGGAPVEPVSKSRGRLIWMAATAVSLAAALALAVLYFRRPMNDGAVQRVSVLAPDDVHRISSLALSPDGKWLAIAGPDRTGMTRIWLRSLDSYDWKPLRGTERGSFPFWSPDSQFVAFFADGKLQKTDLADSRPDTVCELPSGKAARGGTWNRDDQIVYGAGGLGWIISAGGGDSKILYDPGKLTPRGSHGWPSFLPDGQSYLHKRENAIWVGSIASEFSSRILDSQRAVYASPGFLIFERGGKLMTQQFDLSSSKLPGNPITLAEGFDSGYGLPRFSVSERGTLAYIPGRYYSYQTAWFDRAGKQMHQASLEPMICGRFFSMGIGS